MESWFSEEEDGIEGGDDMSWNFEDEKIYEDANGPSEGPWATPKHYSVVVSSLIAGIIILQVDYEPGIRVAKEAETSIWNMETTATFAGDDESVCSFDVYENQGEIVGRVASISVRDGEVGARICVWEFKGGVNDWYDLRPSIGGHQSI